MLQSGEWYNYPITVYHYILHVQAERCGYKPTTHLLYSAHKEPQYQSSTTSYTLGWMKLQQQLHCGKYDDHWTEHEGYHSKFRVSQQNLVLYRSSQQ